MSGAQEHLPGMEPPRIEAIDDAARRYRRIRNERMELTEQEVEARGELTALMVGHKLTTYTVQPDGDGDRLLVTFSPGEPKVKVQKAREPAEPTVEDTVAEDPDGEE